MRNKYFHRKDAKNAKKYFSLAGERPAREKRRRKAKNE
jgi:hypothetical protein